MSANSQYIATLCRQLSQQGKQISVAMIRNQANHPLSIPEVVSVLKKWKQDPTQFQEVDAKPKNNPKKEQVRLEERVEELEKQVAHLSKQLQLLKPK